MGVKLSMLGCHKTKCLAQEMCQGYGALSASDHVFRRHGRELEQFNRLVKPLNVQR